MDPPLAGLEPSEPRQMAEPTPDDEADWSDVPMEPAPGATATPGPSSPHKKHKSPARFGRKFKPYKKKKSSLRKIARRKSLPKAATTLPEDLKTVSSSIDESLTLTAAKLGLNRTQVKSVLKSLCSDSHLLQMIREKAGDVDPKDKNDDPGASTRVEPRVTRTKARNLKEDGGKLDWILEKMEEISRKTPKKDKQAEIPLATVEFPEEDELDDVEYDPKNDPEAVYDEDEDSVANSDGGTPNRSLPQSLTSPNSSFSGAIDMPDCLPTSLEALLDPTSTFKLPSSTIEGSSKSSATRSLNFDHLDDPKPGPSGTWLTRSKANLKDVPIEELENQFVPPDITPDMYDTRVDDYTIFLADTFCKPITPEPIKNPEVAGGHTFDLEESDTEPDPDYNFQEADEFKSEEFDEFKYDRSTKISKKEVDCLINELISAYDLDQSEKSEACKSRRAKQRVQEANQEQLLDSYYAEMTPAPPIECDMSQEQLIVLSHQVRIHIQQLTQMSIMTAHDTELAILNYECKQMANELVQQALTNPHSSCNTETLFPSINFVDEWEQKKLYPHDEDALKCRKPYQPLSLNPTLMQMMGDSGVFIYPSLVPISAINKKNCMKKIGGRECFFSESEDYLIVKILANYCERCHKKGTRYTLSNGCKEVLKTCGYGKSMAQIRSHVLNARRRGVNEVLIHFLRTKQALSLSLDYGSLNAIAFGTKLRNAPMNALPENWQNFFQLSGRKVKKPNQDKWVDPTPLAPMVQAVYDPHSQTVAVQIPEGTQTEVVSTFEIPMVSPPMGEAKRLRPLLPKKPGMELKSLQNSSSPLKKERERILRKYSPLKKKQTRSSSTKPIRPKPVLEVVEAVPMTFDEPEVLLEPMPEVMSMPDLVAAMEEAVAPVAVPEAVVDLEDTRTKQRKSKQQREAEILANVMAEETVDEVNARREREAVDIFKFAERALQPLEFEAFLKTLVTVEENPVKGFQELHVQLQGQVELQEMLLDLLTPELAVKLGHKFYTAFQSRSRHKEFFRKLRRAYEHAPSTHNRILKDIANFLSDPQMDQNSLTSMATRLFRGNPHLHDLFLSLVPNSPVLESRLPSPELINMVDMDNEGSEEVVTTLDAYADGAERISLVDMDTKDEYGGDKCPCTCHAFTNEEEERSGHCIHCSIRFINGKIYMREGKILKPVKVEYPPGQNPYAKADKTSVGNASRKRGAKKAPEATTSSTPMEEESPDLATKEESG